MRGIRRWDLVALFVNGVIGAGIFGLPSRVHALLGPYGPLAYLACALLVLLIVLCFAEVASRFNATGGPYLYARAAFGPAFGFQVGWLVWIARITAFAALLNLFVEYLGHFHSAAVTGWPRAAVITVLILGLAWVNIVGVRRAALAGDVFTIGKLLPLLVFVLVGLFFIDTARFVPVVEPDYAKFSGAVLLLAFAFTGFESALIPAGEVREPRRNMPFGLIATLVIVAPLYLGIQVVCIGTLPSLAESTRPLADAASAFMGQAGGAFIAIGALVSILGTLHGIMLAAPRMLFAMAEHRELPAMLAAVHARHRTPHVAILAVATLLLVLTLSGSFIAALTVSVVVRLIAYAAACAAVPVLRRRREVEDAQFRVPGGLVTVVIALLLIGWLLTTVSAREVLHVAIALAVGVALYAGSRWRATSAARDPRH